MGGLAGHPFRPAFRTLTWAEACSVWAGCGRVEGGLNELESGQNFWILVLQVGFVNILKVSG